LNFIKLQDKLDYLTLLHACVHGIMCSLWKYLTSC